MISTYKYQQKKNKKRKHQAPEMRRKRTSRNDVASGQPPQPPPPHLEESTKNKKHKHQAPEMRRKQTSRNDVASGPPPPPPPPPPHVEESPFIDTSESMKRTRGTSKNLTLQRLPPGIKLPLEWDKYDCPMGIHANAFSTQCGIIVKLPENCPLQKTSFMDIEEERRRRLIDVVMEHFDFERTERRDQYILSKLGKKYNEYKTDLRKKHYLKHNTNAERLADRPTNVSREDWRWLVKFWTADKKFQNRSRQNRANSSRLTLRHISGSKSYARQREEWEKEKEKEPSRLEIFEITHDKKDEASVSVFNAFERAKRVNENTDEAEQLSDEAIYSLQFPQKRAGRMHGMGLIVKPSQLGLSNASPSWLRQQEQQEAIDGLKGKCSELQCKLSEMKKQFSSMVTSMKELCTAQGVPIHDFPNMVGDSCSVSTPFSDRLRIKTGN